MIVWVLVLITCSETSGLYKPKAYYGGVFSTKEKCLKDIPKGSDYICKKTKI
jgi:hypothetical protein